MRHHKAIRAIFNTLSSVTGSSYIATQTQTRYRIWQRRFYRSSICFSFWVVNKMSRV